MLEIFSFCCKIKDHFFVGNQDSASFKLAINLKNDNDFTIYCHDIIIQFFWRCFVSLVRFSYWSKFHVNMITGSGVMAIFFYKGLTRNLKRRNTRVWILPNIWGLRQVRDTKVAKNISNEMSLNAAKWQGYSFYRFWVIKWKATEEREGGGGGNYPPFRLGLMVAHRNFMKAGSVGVSPIPFLT